jgi:hypothetical protein
MRHLSGHEKHDHSVMGSGLIFLGGILALIFPILPLALIFLLRNYIGVLLERIGSLIVSNPGESEFYTNVAPHLTTWIVGFIAIGAIFTIILGVVAIYAYTLVKREKLRSGGLLATVAGVGMIATLHWIPGFITIIGGVLCYTSSKVPYPTIQGEPKPSDEVWVPRSIE